MNWSVVLAALTLGALRLIANNEDEGGAETWRAFKLPRIRYARAADIARTQAPAMKGMTPIMEALARPSGRIDRSHVPQTLAALRRPPRLIRLPEHAPDGLREERSKCASTVPPVVVQDAYQHSLTVNPPVARQLVVPVGAHLALAAVIDECVLKRNGHAMASELRLHPAVIQVQIHPRHCPSTPTGRRQVAWPGRRMHSTRRNNRRRKRLLPPSLAPLDRWLTHHVMLRPHWGPG